MPPHQPAEDRLGLVADYYQVSQSLLSTLRELPHVHRKEPCQKQGINPHIFRALLDYDRYPQAQFIHKTLKGRNESMDGLSVLDFGCHVSDYGIYFSRLGAKVGIYDATEAVKFAAYRFGREGLGVEKFTMPYEYRRMMTNRTLVIFGEVLEHMASPLGALKTAVACSVKYIFTSHYPYGDDSYFALSGHRKSAQDQQAACRELLEANYQGKRMPESAFLWQKKTD
jgi:hypothetical protein